MSEISNRVGIQTVPVDSIDCPSCGTLVDVRGETAFDTVPCPRCDSPVVVPARLGDYLLLDELGKGAMGVVFLAQDTNLNRNVALKVLRKEFGESEKMLEMIRQEAQAMAALNHVNVINIYSFGSAHGQPFLVMELCPGDTLLDYLKTGVDEAEMLRIGLGVLAGLEAAEKARITHGDIKPANVLVSTKGTPKVVDFGLARFSDSTHEDRPLWGTPYYIPPEKARKKGEDARSDQYSLGASMFHLLARKPPYTAKDPIQVLKSALNDPTPFLKEVKPEISQRTSDLIHRMMEKDPADRFRSYQDLRESMLDAYEALTGVPAPNPSASGSASSASLPSVTSLGLSLKQRGASSTSPVASQQTEKSATPIDEDGFQTISKAGNSSAMRTLTMTFDEAIDLAARKLPVSLPVQTLKNGLAILGALLILGLGAIFSYLAAAPN